MIEAVIFDMDGVIIDSEPVHLRIEQEILRKLGIRVTEKEHASYIGTTSYYMWETIKERHGLQETVEELVSLDRANYRGYLLANPKDLAPIEGAVELMEALAGNNFRLAIASSSPLNIIEVVVKSLKLDAYFKVLVSGDQVPRSKPEPDIFLYAAAKLGSGPEKCLVIEDSGNGIKAAKQAKMKAIGFINPNSGNQDLTGADLIIKAFPEITRARLETLSAE